MLNSSQCSCILTDTCVANTPCANNGTCVLGSSPDNYTCDCSGTNFMGVNCSGDNIQVGDLINTNTIKVKMNTK